MPRCEAISKRTLKTPFWFRGQPDHAVNGVASTYFEYISVRILEPVLVHKAEFLCFVVGCAGGGDSFADHIIDFFPAVG